MYQFFAYLLISGFAAGLSAQETFYPSEPGGSICGRAKAIIDNLGPGRGVPMAAGDLVEWGVVGNKNFPSNGVPLIIPPAERLAPTTFSMMGQDGKTIALPTLKGQVVVIGLWSMACEPSLFQLMEMVDLQKKGDQNGFQVFPVNYDEGQDRWPRLIRYLKRVKDRLVDPKVYSPGLGKGGVNSLANLIPALPAIFILDREGRVAARYAGYRPGSMVNALLTILREPKETLAPSVPATSTPAPQ